jgi:hypothetical protein
LGDYLDSLQKAPSASFPVLFAHLESSTALQTDGATRAQQVAAALASITRPVFTKDPVMRAKLKAKWTLVWSRASELLDHWIIHPDDMYIRSWPTSTLRMAIVGCAQVLCLTVQDEDLQTDDVVYYCFALWIHLPSSACLWKLRAEMTEWGMNLNYAMAGFAGNLGERAQSQSLPLAMVMRDIMGRLPPQEWNRLWLAYFRQDLAREDPDEAANAARLAGSDIMILHHFFYDSGVLASVAWLSTIPLVMQALSKLCAVPFRQDFVALVAICGRHILHASTADNGEKWVYLALKEKFLIHLVKVARWSMLARAQGQVSRMLHDILSEAIVKAVMPHLFHLDILRLAAFSLGGIRSYSADLGALRSLLGSSIQTMERIIDEWEPLTHGLRADALGSLGCHNAEVCLLVVQLRCQFTHHLMSVYQQIPLPQNLLGLSADFVLLTTLSKI